MKPSVNTRNASRTSVFFGAVALIVTSAVLPASAEAQTTAGPADLLASPQSGAKLVKSLPQNSPLKILQRQGFWLEVEVGSAKGWVKATGVKFGSGDKSLGGIDTGRTGKGNIVSSSAARGLSPKELISAKPDFSQVDQLQKLAVSQQDAAGFAAQGNLSTRKLALLATSNETRQPSAGSSPRKAKAQKGKNKAEMDVDDED